MESGIASWLRFNRIGRPDISIRQFTHTLNALQMLTKFSNVIDHLAAARLAVELAFPSTPRLKTLLPFGKTQGQGPGKEVMKTVL